MNTNSRNRSVLVLTAVLPLVFLAVSCGKAFQSDVSHAKSASVSHPTIRLEAKADDVKTDKLFTELTLSIFSYYQTYERDVTFDATYQSFRVGDSQNYVNCDAQTCLINMASNSVSGPSHSLAAVLTLGKMLVDSDEDTAIDEPNEAAPVRLGTSEAGFDCGVKESVYRCTLLQ